jgi:hypothetical protein
LSRPPRPLASATPSSCPVRRARAPFGAQQPHAALLENALPRADRDARRGRVPARRLVGSARAPARRGGLADGRHGVEVTEPTFRRQGRVRTASDAGAAGLAVGRRGGRAQDGGAGAYLEMLAP